MASGKQSIHKHCATKCFEAIPRNISASKSSRYTVLKPCFVAISIPFLPQLQTCYDRVRASSLCTTITVDQEERGQGRRLGTPRRVQFSRDVQTFLASSPRTSSTCMRQCVILINDIFVVVLGALRESPSFLSEARGVAVS